MVAWAWSCAVRVVVVVVVVRVVGAVCAVLTDDESERWAGQGSATAAAVETRHEERRDVARRKVGGRAWALGIYLSGGLISSSSPAPIPIRHKTSAGPTLT